VELTPFRVRLAMVTRDMVPKLWPIVEPFLKAAEAENSLQTVNEWLADCTNGNAQLWVAVSDVDTVEGAGITRLTNCPSGKICLIEAFGAKLGNDALLETVETWAKSEGCKSVRIYGRLGWMHRLKSYRPIGAILERRL
jgi:hypothetical protein